MRRVQLSRRLMGGLLAAGLMAAGLPSRTAAAAGGPNLALGKPLAVSGSQAGYPPGNATDGNQASYWESVNNAFPQWLQVDLGSATAIDGNLGTYWEGNGHPATLTVKLGANADLTSVVVKLNPDPIWGPRNQTIEILGRDQGATGFSSLRPAAGYAFSPSANQNSVTIPVSGRAADVQLRFTANSGAPGVASGTRSASTT